MAKKDFNKYGKEQRLRAYKKCEKCHGAPPTVACNLQGLIFNRCDLSMELVGDYYKEGAPIKVKEIKSHDKHVNVDPANIEQEITPGKQVNSFGKLKIV